MDKLEVLNKITNGYYIATALKPAEELETREKDYLAAATVNWVSQVAFDPPMVSVAVGLYSDLNETIDYSEAFTLHVLSDQHMDLVEKFADESEVTDQKINGVPYRKEGREIELENSLAMIHCRLKESVRCGDHTLHLGEVVDVKEYSKNQPLSTVALPSSYRPDIAETSA